MLILGFCLGLAVGISFWVWQQFQLNRHLEQVLRPLNVHSNWVGLPLIPSLRQEITSVQHQRQHLQQKLQTYKDLLEFAPVGYLQVDEENQLLWCNEKAQEILYLQRWQPGQVRLLLEIVRSYELDRLIELTRDRQILQVKEWVFHPSYENTAAMKEMKSTVVRATSLPLAQGKVGVFLENRQPMQELNQARDRAFSDLAHELRTPLTSIRLLVETLQDRLDTRESLPGTTTSANASPFKRWVDRLMLEVDRLIHLVQSWLDLTQLETNPTVQLNYQKFDVRSLITSVWETLEPLAQRQDIEFTYSGPQHLWMKGDQTRIYQVFINLLDNSIKYSPPHAKIHIEAKVICENTTIPPTLEVNIIDSGFGFSEVDLPQVFERFYRGDTARSRSSKTETNSAIAIVGTGLGLAIVRQIILAHGGSIKAMNHPEFGGAWIQIELPALMAN
ncbi:ATP-binding protein [Calothrix sp. PCC 6303]|uniref:ATP-binding protein n=1 Tax=Calothrix sp. PCC 6303 TaxID=1170562 RepID=UPI0002A00348|nr:ATP-binding protein [Calothrix sp. PCC 6303]AFZ00661.1 histidine kinase [Calothrix sp. PCC 6303]